MAKDSNRSQEINTYEEARKQRLQDNLKRFEDLGILKISKSLSEITDSEKKSPQCLAKPKPKRSIDMLELRRSSRARNPVPSYFVEPDIGLATPRKRSKTAAWKSYLGRPANEVKFASDEERACAIHSAERLQSNLGSKNPSFVKSMVRSHVYSCFWLGLPNKFCKDHLPTKEVKMILEDEDGSEYDAIYIGCRGGLSGGWRGFALDHKLDDGDALVFELSEPTRFKIYIVRASNLGQKNSTYIRDKKVNGITNDASIKLNKNYGGKVKQKGKAAKAIDVEADEGSASQKRQQNVRLYGKSEVQKEKKTDNGTQAASKNRKQKTGVNGEIEVKDERIEAEVRKEKIAWKGNRCASPKQQQDAGVSGKSEVKQEKMVETPVQKEKKTDKGTRAASKNRKQKTGVNGELEVKDERIEAEVQKEKIAGKGNRYASPKQQKDAGVSAKREVKRDKMVENGEKSVSLKPQEEDDGNKLSRKRCMSTKLFRRKVY